MRKLLGFLILGLGILLTYFLQTSHRIGGNALPAFGKLLNPTTGIWQNATENTQDIELQSPHLRGTVRILFDQRLVPHIYAENLSDALFAQGYVEAYHRLFQMDISTRSAEGSLAEILGPDLVDYDKNQRRLGMGYAAEVADSAWKLHPEDYALLEAYSQGVNLYMQGVKTSDLPIEYKLLDFKPSEWSPYRSALMFKAMTKTLAGYEEDVEFSNALKLLGGEDFEAVYPEINPLVPVVARQQSTPTPAQQADNQPFMENSFMSSSRTYTHQDGVGSNSWAVSGERSATGYPILANDPHLGLSLPSIWYEIEISTPEFTAHGVTLLGIPGIMIGFNQDIAWGETNAGHDVMDYHQIAWADAEKKTYTLDGKTLPVQYRIEEIPVKGNPTIYDTVKYTHWGPVVTKGSDLALRWLAHNAAPQSELMTFISAMACSNYDEFLEATSAFQCPAQNFTYADRHGTIGLRVNGNLPRRQTKGQGRGVSRGDSSLFGWNGYIPRNENPQERNPDRGYVMSANQRSAGKDYPYYIWGDFSDYRCRTADSMLRTIPKLSAKDAMAMQNSTFNFLASDAYPVLRKYLDSSWHATLSSLNLDNWDYHYTANSKSATFFEVWFWNTHRLLWDEVYAFMDSIDLPAPEPWTTVNLLKTNPNSKFVDVVSTPETEQIETVVSRAFQNTLEELGEDPPEWGDYKRVNIPHLTRLPAFSTSDLKIGGHKYSLNAMQSTFGPSWRMIVELGDEVVAYVTYPGGQSGNPASPFYANRIKEWSEGNYTKIGLTSKENISPVFTISITHE